MSKEEQIEKLKQMSGQDAGERPTYDVPQYRLHGTKGHFEVQREDEDGEWQKEKIDSDTITITVLRVRRKFLNYIKSEEKTLWSTEYNNNSEETRLFESVAGESKLIDEGTAPALRERQNLSGATNYVLYGIIDGEVAKLTVKGAGLEPWFDYTNELGDKDTPLFMVETKVDKEKIEDGPIDYYRMTFEAGDEVEDLDVLEATMEEMNKNINEIDEYVQARIEENASIEEKQEAEKKTNDEEIDYPEDEDITPEDVPF